MRVACCSRSTSAPSSLVSRSRMAHEGHAFDLDDARDDEETGREALARGDLLHGPFGARQLVDHGEAAATLHLRDLPRREPRARVGLEPRALASADPRAALSEVGVDDAVFTLEAQLVDQPRHQDGEVVLARAPRERLGGSVRGVAAFGGEREHVLAETLVDRVPRRDQRRRARSSRSTTWTSSRSRTGRDRCDRSSTCTSTTRLPERSQSWSTKTPAAHLSSA